MFCCFHRRGIRSLHVKWNKWNVVCFALFLLLLFFQSFFIFFFCVPNRSKRDESNKFTFCVSMNSVVCYYFVSQFSTSSFLFFAIQSLVLLANEWKKWIWLKPFRFYSFFVSIDCQKYRQKYSNRIRNLVTFSISTFSN